MSKYQPSNGTEGMWFLAKFCDNCKWDKKYRETQEGSGCGIILKMMAFDVYDSRYPKQLINTEEKGPHCTKFEEPAERKSKKYVPNDKTTGRLFS